MQYAAPMFARPSGGMSNWGGFQLPQGSAPTSFKPQDVLASYNANHAASRNANQDLFNRTAQGFDSVLAKQERDLAGAFQYLHGTNRSNIRNIDRRFTRESGNVATEMIDRGLGNSTIQSAMQTGVQRNHADAISESRAQFGGKMYDAASKNALANSGLAQQQHQFLMANTNIGYPDVSAYAQMAMLGAQQALPQQGQQYATQPGNAYAGFRTGNTGMGPQSPVFYAAGSDGGAGYMPSSGANLFSGWAGQASSSPAGPNSAAISGWGRTEAGEMYPSYATSGQYAATGGGGRAEADYSAYAPQGAVDYSVDPMW